jgi:hypothetical protein
VVIDQGAASPGVVPYLPLPDLRRAPPAAPQSSQNPGGTR